MIPALRHKGLSAFFEMGSMAGIQPAHAPMLAGKLRRLNETIAAQGLNLPSWDLHPSKGRDLKGYYALWVSGNWRLTFTFEGTAAVLVDYLDDRRPLPPEKPRVQPPAPWPGPAR